MDEVFLLLDRTVSLPGRQILYHRLRVLEPEDTVLAERTRQYAAIQAASAWAAAARKPLARLGGRKAAWLPALLMDGIPEGPRRSWLYYGFGLAPALCLAVSFWVPGFLFAAFAMAIPNLVINEIQGPRMTGYFPALSQLHSLLGASLEVAALPGAPDLPQVAFLRENLPVLKAIRKRLGALSVDRTRLPELVSALFHFSEQVVDGTCAFDYRLHLGLSRSRNAIRLLELSGYPAAVTEEARRLADPQPRPVG